MQKIDINTSKTNLSRAVIPLEKGKIPPQAIELEEAILGAMMTDKKGVDEVIDILSPEAFYRLEHQSIFRAILILFQKSEPIDLLTVSYELKKMKLLEAVGGDFYLIKLSKKVTSSAHIEHHARFVLEQFIKRSLIEISNQIIGEAYDDSTDALELLDNSEAKLYDVVLGNIKRTTTSAQELVLKAKNRIEEIHNKEGISGVLSGFNRLDALTSGWQPSDLIIIAARPGMGKTAFSLSMARNIAIDSGLPVAFFSLEMSALQLITRLISSETGLSSKKLRTGDLKDHEWQQLSIKVKSLEQAPLYIDDEPSLSIFELRAKARRLVSRHGIKIIIVDYLQLMTAGTKQKLGNREQEISTISRNLKALAKELDIPVIAIAQLSRAVETRGGTRRPFLSDLRESGAIEQDADIVSFIYRPEYYKIEEWDDDASTPTKGQAEFIVAKHRNGDLENIRLKFIGHLGRFENIQDIDFHEGSDEIQSKMNTPEIDTKNLPSSGEVFGENQHYDKDDGLPF